MMQILLFSFRYFLKQLLLLMFQNGGFLLFFSCNAIEIVTFYVFFALKWAANIGLSWFSVMVFW